MTDEKKPRGRPRVYPTNAARKKAYRERKKAERLELIKRIEKLEKQISETGEKISTKKLVEPILNLTLAQIENKTTDELQKIVDTINHKFPVKRDLFSPLSVIVDDIIESCDPLGINTKVKIDKNKIIAEEVQKNYREFEQSLNYLTILNVVESVIATREHRDTTDYELEILEQKITELEQAVAKKKEEELKIKK